MTIRKRLAYATRGFRGGENVTETRFVDGKVTVEEFGVPEITVEEEKFYEIGLEVLQEELSVDVSLVNELTVVAEVPTQSVEVSQVGAEVSIDGTPQVEVAIN